MKHWSRCYRLWDSVKNSSHIPIIVEQSEEGRTRTNMDVGCWLKWGNMAKRVCEPTLMLWRLHVAIFQFQCINNNLPSFLKLPLALPFDKENWASWNSLFRPYITLLVILKLWLLQIFFWYQQKKISSTVT